MRTDSITITEWWDVDCFIWRQAVSMVAGFLNQYINWADQSKIIIRDLNDLDPHEFMDAKKICPDTGRSRSNRIENNGL